MPIDVSQVVRGQYEGYRSIPGVADDSQTETFIALKCEIDNWRWAGVPFYLRTGKNMAQGARIISIAFREPPKSMFPADSGIGAHGPDHLTFDLADSSKLSLSFYGKRPGPGMQLDKLSLQFALHETEHETDVLEAYERLIHDAMSGDHTLFTAADDIERLWELSAPLLEHPPDVELYPTGTWGPPGIHDLIAPNAWRLPFERGWRQWTEADGRACPTGPRAEGPADRVTAAPGRPAPASSTRPPGSGRGGTARPARPAPWRWGCRRGPRPGRSRPGPRSRRRARHRAGPGCRAGTSGPSTARCPGPG